MRAGFCRVLRGVFNYQRLYHMYVSQQVLLVGPGKRFNLVSRLKNARLRDEGFVLALAQFNLILSDILRKANH